MNKDLTDCSYEFKYFDYVQVFALRQVNHKKLKKMFKVFFLALNCISKKNIIST